MYNIIVYENKRFGNIRTFVEEGKQEPWFVAADVCRALEVKNARDAVARLDDDEKNTVVLTDGNRGNPNVTVVSEPGLYALVLSSRKPEAFAVIWEEVEEVKEDMQRVITKANDIWLANRRDDIEAFQVYADKMAAAASLLACEAVQVAAMCMKAQKGGATWSKSKIG